MTIPSALASGQPLRAHWSIIRALAARSLKVRYRGSVLGVLWSLSNPLLMTAVYTAIFGTAFAAAYGGSILNYTLAVFVALAVLAFYSTSTSQALSSVVANGQLLNKIALPAYVFPVSAVLANAFQLLIGAFPLLLVVTVARAHSLINILDVVVSLLALIMLASGIGVALSALYVFFRDLPYLYEVLTFMLYMTTPVFYPASLVPSNVRVYLQLNPVAATVSALRASALSPDSPSAATIWGPFAVDAGCLIAGFLIFFALRNDFADLL